MIRLSQHQFLRILTSGRAAHQRQGRTHRRRRTQRRTTRPRPSPATRPGLERRLSPHPTHSPTQDRPRSCPPTQTGGGASRHRLSLPSVAEAYSAQGSGSTLQGRAPALLRRTPPIPRKYADQRHVDVQVLAQPAAYTGQLAVGLAAVQLAWLRLLHGAALLDCLPIPRMTSAADGEAPSNRSSPARRSVPRRHPPRQLLVDRVGARLRCG